MKKKMKKRLAGAAGILAAAVSGAVMILPVAGIVWKLTDWEIQDVIYTAIILVLLVLYLFYAALSIRRSRTRVRLIEQKRAAQKRWDGFRDIIIKGELVEVEDPETGLTEIRNIVAKE